MTRNQLKRRTLLTGVLASVSGCTTSGILPPTGEDRDETEDSRYPALRIDSVQAPARPVVEFGVEIESGFTDESPATIVIRVRNTGDSVLEYHHGPSLPYPPAVGTSEENTGRLYLIPANETGIASEATLIPERPTDHCWRATSEKLGVYEMAASRSLQPGEEMTRTYVLLSPLASDPCLPEGEYTFSASPVIDGMTYEWQFGVTVHG